MKHSLLTVKYFLMTVLMALAVGCAQLGMPTPQTFNQNVAVSVASISAVRTSAATLLSAGKITVEDARNIQAQADLAREGLVVARTLQASDPLAAQNRLATVSAVLQALQTYLASKGT